MPETVLALSLMVWLSAAPRGNVTVSTSPPVMLLQTAANPETSRREQRLFEQLGLVLDDFSVLMTPPPVNDFVKKTLPDQIAAVIPDASNEGAVAVIWLNIPAPEQIMLNLVAIGTGRTLVRTVEVAKSPNAERTLAMMLRELLGTAYLFERSQAVPPAIQKVVDQVTHDVAQPATAQQHLEPPPPEPPSSKERFFVSAQLLAASGIAGQLGDSFRPGLEPSAEIKVGDFLFGAQAMLMLGPYSAAPAQLTGVELSIGLHATWLIPVSRVLVGPTIGIDADYLHANANDASTDLSRGVLRGGAIARFLLGEKLQLLASLTLLGSPSRLELKAMTDMGPQVIYREGSLQVRLGLGFTLPL
jgi:hypothetical protein